MISCSSRSYFGEICNVKQNKWRERNPNQVLSLSAKVFENIKGGKSSFTIHRGENQIQCKVEFESSIKQNACRVKELLNSFFPNLENQCIHGRLL